MFVSGSFLRLPGVRIIEEFYSISLFLLAGLRLLFDNFESASQKRVNSIGSENDNPTVYLGTGGISYALFRALTTLEVS